MSATQNSSNDQEGAWVGIDFGTSNCACAVWDSFRGRPKLLQLGIAWPRKHKTGRIVPSAVLTGEGEIMMIGNTKATVGYEALKMMQDDSEVSKACVFSVKRLIGLDEQDDSDFLKSLPFDVCKEDDGSLSILLSPLGGEKDIKLSPEEVVVCILGAIRHDAEAYLRRNITKKDLQIPGSSPVVTNCVIGVPAHFSRNQRQLIETASRRAGFSGSVSTIIESTAASLAYGLFVSVPTEKHIMVLDMGGGTTDVTIATLAPDEEFTVVATQGDSKLGGDDVDEEIMKFLLKNATTTTSDRRTLLLECRKCKEALCGIDNDTPPADSYDVALDKESFGTMKQEDFSECIASHVERARQLIESVVSRTGLSIDEVVLVGGGTRVPAIREMLRTLFPSIPDLCMSLNPEGAVAQGAAIQAAVKSKTVPLSELKSALMLDALPHAIGVLRPDGVTYVPVLEKDAKLPARGVATFELEETTQAGVTIVAVEDVGGDALEQVGKFTFLLRRLPEEELKRLNDGKRSVDIGMVMETSGAFVVSIFDENDPEHVRKKKRRQQEESGEILIDFSDENKEEGVPLVLLLLLALLFVVYVAVKLAFHEVVERESASVEATVDVSEAAEASEF